MKILMDDSKRVLVRGTSLKHGYDSAWYKVYGTKNPYIVVKNQKTLLSALTQIEDYTWVYNSTTGETWTVSQFQAA